MHVKLDFSFKIMLLERSIFNIQILQVFIKSLKSIFTLHVEKKAVGDARARS